MKSADPPGLSHAEQERKRGSSTGMCEWQTCCKCADVPAVRGHPGNSCEVEISGSNSWHWTANIERGTKVKVDHIVRPNGHIVIAVISW